MVAKVAIAPPFPPSHLVWDKMSPSTLQDLSLCAASDKKKKMNKTSLCSPPQ